MLTFIDDSGDPGFKVDKGSSRHFVIACCVFTSPRSAEDTADEIRQFKTENRLTHKSELKFSKKKREINMAFISHFSTRDFFVRAIMKVLSRPHTTITDAKVNL